MEVEGEIAFAFGSEEDGEDEATNVEGEGNPAGSFDGGNKRGT